MAYGVIMGQTPILNASGVTYDNSQTSNIITANNVQQAIDASVGKLGALSNGLQWVKLGERQLKSERDATLNTTLTLGNSFVNTDNCIALMNLISGSVTVRIPNEFQLLFGDVPIINYGESSSFNNLCSIGIKYSNRKILGFHTIVDDYNGFLVKQMTDEVKARNSASSRFSYDFTQTVYGLKLL